MTDKELMQQALDTLIKVTHISDYYPTSALDAIQTLRTRLAEPAPEPEQDAARYRFLKDRMLGADLDWNGSGEAVMVFSWSAMVPMSDCCDENIDAAMLAAAHGIKL